MHCVWKTAKQAVECCFHKHITHFWENKSVTLNQDGFLQKWIWKYGFLIMITHNGYYQISPPNQTVWSLLIFLTALMRGTPPGFSHRWTLLTYSQTAETEVEDQFVLSGCVAQIFLERKKQDGNRRPLLLTDTFSHTVSPVCFYYSRSTESNTKERYILLSSFLFLTSYCFNMFFL